MANIIKFSRFIGTDVDIDTCNDVTDDCIAFVGPVKLTDAGKEEFGCLMDLDVTVSIGNCAVVEMPVERTMECVKTLNKFLTYAAGYCQQSTYERLFVELSGDELYGEDIEEVLANEQV